jgi:hypothetical protein
MSTIIYVVLTTRTDFRGVFRFSVTILDQKLEHAKVVGTSRVFEI